MKCYSGNQALNRRDLTSDALFSLIWIVFVGQNHYGIDLESVSVECNTQFTHSSKSKVSLSKIVGEKSRSVYRKKRKKNFSGRRKQEEESEEAAPVVDEIASSTPSTSRDENQLSDSDFKETVGSSRKKMKYADEELLLDSSDVEYTFNTEEGKISAPYYIPLHTAPYYIMHSVLEQRKQWQNNTFLLGKQIYFTIVRGCTETLPRGKRGIWIYRFEKFIQGGLKRARVGERWEIFL